MMKLVLATILLLLSVSCADAIPCQSRRGDDGSYWQWRLIDSRRCWYPGHRKLPKTQLQWIRDPRPATVTAVRTPTAAEPPPPPPPVAQSEPLLPVIRMVRSIPYREEPAEPELPPAATPRVVLQPPPYAVIPAVRAEPEPRRVSWLLFPALALIAAGAAMALALIARSGADLAGPVWTALDRAGKAVGAIWEAARYPTARALAKLPLARLRTALTPRSFYTGIT